MLRRSTSSSPTSSPGRCASRGDISKALRRGGSVVLSGILNPEAAAVVAAYTAHGFILVQQRRIGEWTTLTLRKRR